MADDASKDPAQLALAATKARGDGEPLVTTEHSGLKRRPVAGFGVLHKLYAQGERDFRGAHLAGSDLKASTLTGADLTEADLCGAHLSNTGLNRAILDGSKFTNSSWLSVKTHGASMNGASIDRVKIQKSEMRGTKMRGAGLQSTFVIDSDLRNVDLRDADLTGARFERVKLQEANLEGATLAGAVFKDCSLEDANLRSAVIDDRTRMSGSTINLATMRDSGWTTRKVLALDLTLSKEILDAAGFEPYPPDAIEQLVALTTARRRAPADESPQARGERQKSIDELVTRLRIVPPPSRDDVVLGARLLRILGKGTFGVVWEAVDGATGRHVAVKVLDQDRLGLEQTAFHFRQGVVAMQHLTKVADRPKTVIELIRADESRLVFTMPLIERGDLSENPGWTVERVLEIFRDVCEAVRFAHNNGVLHRDIKPTNIVLDAGGTAVLTDFDIADLLYLKSQSARVAGTVTYAAPEQLKGTDDRSFTGDVYSLGRLLHFLLLGRDPDLSFEASPLLPDLQGKPEGLVRIVRKCTMRDPARRYANVADLIIDLDKYTKTPRRVGIGTRNWPLWLTLPELTEAQSKTLAAVVAALATIGAALIGAGRC